VRRRLFTALSVLSLVGLVAAAAVAERHNHTDLYFHRTRAGRYIMLRMWPGNIGLGVSYRTVRSAGGPDVAGTHRWGHMSGAVSPWPLPPVSGMNRLGFMKWDMSVTQFHPNGETAESRTWVAPMWVLYLLLLALPAARVAAVIRRRCRRQSGCCTHCGYNLTGNTSGVCPECGTATRAGAQPESESSPLGCHPFSTAPGPQSLRRRRSRRLLGRP
jgi:hypothetical protein